ncbi:ankyrin [Patellaria atrata CBS 101060]|uniref:Ankyrin n=1 Tax=Patellaria atrata CBS 101060 TaxID=1346257 RepID=A0A9P4SIK1_9PEZI|nr:ankyrin [Patellaria atrata CBS 101060]
MDPEAKSKYAIHEACREGRTAEVEALLNANPRLATRRDEDDRLPLHWAVSYNRLPIVRLLVLSKEFDVDAQDGLGWTPLMMAASLRDGEEVLELLLSRGAEVNIQTISEGHADAAVFLLKEGAVADIVDREGRRALELAPDAKVRDFILRSAEREGIDLG